jgi:hypothetical protein
VTIRKGSEASIVVTRFACRTRRQLVSLVIAHSVMKRRVRQQIPQLVGASVVINWKLRYMYSVSIWPDRHTIERMGSVPAHVQAAHTIERFGIETRCGVFQYMGDWREVLFGEGWGGAASGVTWSL